MGVFLSVHIQKLDTKGRVSIPADFRKLLDQESVVLYRSYKESEVLECVSMMRMNKLSKALDTLDPFDNSVDDATASIFADARNLKFDLSGRVTLSSDLISHCKFQDEVAFVGRGETFQMWHPQKFSEYQQNAHARIRQAMQLKASKNVINKEPDA